MGNLLPRKGAKVHKKKTGILSRSTHELGAPPRLKSSCLFGMAAAGSEDPAISVNLKL